MTYTQATGNGTQRGNSYYRVGKRWKPMLIFSLLAFAIFLVGSFVFQRYKESIKREKQDELGGIAELKTRQITNWITERKSNAQVIRDDTLLVAAIERWLRYGDRAGKTRAKLAGRLVSLQQTYAAYGYTSISLFDDKAMLRLSSSTDEAQIQGEEKAGLLESMRTGQIVFSEVHRDEKALAADAVEIELRAPLVLVKNGKRYTVGAILFRIDPYRFLFPLIQDWPTPSPSAENMLVRRDGDEVLFLNKLRYSNNMALSMRLPLSQPDLPAAMAALGRQGRMEGVDYRGVPVVGVLSEVPGTSWEMVSQIDQAEIYAPINSLAGWAVVLMLTLTGAGGSLAIFWRERRHAQEIERQVLTRHLHYLTKYANDIIMLVDGTGKIVDFNDRAIETYGYSATEFASLNIDDLRASDVMPQRTENLMNQPDSQAVQEFHKLTASIILVKTNMFRFETTHRSKNKTELPVEVQLQLVHEKIGESLFVVIVRDISDRKRAEKEMFGQKAFMWQVIDTDSNQIFVKDEQGKFILVNQSAAAAYGLTPNEMVGRNLAEICSSQQDAEANLQADRKVIEEGGELSQIEPYMLPNGEQRWLHTVKKRLTMPDGRMSVLGIAMDITQQKLSEIKLDKSYKELQRLSLHLESVRADERAKIAYNLHDEMGATLVAIKMSIAWLASKLPAESLQLSAEAAHITELVTGGIHTMRQIVTQLMPNQLDELGLTAAIHDYVKKFRQHSNIECHLDLPDKALIQDADRSLTIFRILQESLNNVIKHAQASSVSVIISARDGTLSMLIKDNGIGFNQAMHKDQSFGLLGIRERAMMVGGKAEISSSSGKGTMVSVTIPQFTPQPELTELHDA